jgi:hypothetical protein
LVKDQKVRIHSRNLLGQVAGKAIFNSQQQTLAIVDHENQSLFVLNVQSIEKIGGTLSAAVGAVHQQMENLPANQRDKMLDMIRGFGLSVPEQETPRLQLKTGSERSYKGI